MGRGIERSNTQSTTAVAQKLDIIVYVQDEQLCCTISEHMVFKSIATITMAYKPKDDRGAGIWMEAEPLKISEINWVDEDPDVIEVEWGSYTEERQQRKAFMDSFASDEKQAIVEKECDDVVPHVRTTVKGEPKLSRVVPSCKEEDPFSKYTISYATFIMNA